MAKKRKRKRCWYITRQRGSNKIKCLFSARSELDIRKELSLKKSDDSVIIEKARRWHLAKVFSGLPIFYEYAGDNFEIESVESYVENDFKMILDGDPISANNTPLIREKILVKIL